jgi:oligoendopeptidase F
MKITLAHAVINFSATAPASAANPALGALPEWKLQDLYPSATSTAFVSDMEKAGKAAAAFEEKWKGRLAGAATKTGEEGIGQALREYEALEDIMGRLGSFAGLTYFSDTTNPVNGKLYGDVQAKLTEFSSHLLFFSLELNRIDDAVMDACMANDPAAGHYRPWLVDLRKDKPYQLDDRLEQLFLEKSMTSAAAFNRLFDETMAELRFTIDGEKLPLEVALNLLQEKDPEVRRKAAMALAETFKANIRTFTLITNTLAKDKEIADRWRGFEDIADSRHLANRVEREVVDALAAAVKEAYPRL